jgi:hypothetical protein
MFYAPSKEISAQPKLQFKKANHIFWSHKSQYLKSPSLCRFYWLIYAVQWTTNSHWLQQIISVRVTYLRCKLSRPYIEPWSKGRVSYIRPCLPYTARSIWPTESLTECCPLKSQNTILWGLRKGSDLEFIIARASTKETDGGLWLYHWDRYPRVSADRENWNWDERRR